MAEPTSRNDSYPRQIQLSDGTEVTIRKMTAGDQTRILEFAARLPEDDLLFLRTDITDPGVLAEWVENIRRGHTVTLIAEVNGEIAGYASVHLNQARWTRRVGEIRINSGTRFRGRGLGRRLASEAYEVARGLGLKKLAAQMTPDQIAARSAFERLGFRVEAVLTDWVEDRSGNIRDMLIMTLDLAGLTDQVIANP